MDIFSAEKRSEIMKAVKCKDSKMELSLRTALHKSGLRYRKHVRTLPGTPDIAFIGKKLVVFVDSCFWHGCRWHGGIPATNTEFWSSKILRNKKRDRTVDSEYKKMGWTILRLWEHELDNDFGRCIDRVFEALGLAKRDVNM